MEEELLRTSSTVGETNLHLQLTPAYRRDIFVDRGVWELTLIYIREKLKKMDILMLAAECGPDHDHLFLANWKKYSIEYYRSANKRIFFLYDEETPLEFVQE